MNSGYEVERKLPSGTSELHYMMMNGTSTNSSLVGNQFSNTSQTVFKQKSSLHSRTGSKTNNSKTDKTGSRNYLNQLSSNDSMQNSNTSQGVGNSNSNNRSNRSNFSKASSRKRSMSKKKHTKLSQVDILNDTGCALGMNIDMVEEEGSVDLD